MSSYSLGWHIMKERMSAGRMLVIWPLLAMFILFSSWGLSDPKANLPAELVIDSAYDVMLHPLHSSFFLLLWERY